MEMCIIFINLIQDKICLTMKHVSIVVALLIGVAFLVNAQEQPVHKKRIYVSPEGKIYHNKSLPVYFFISDSPDPNANPRFIIE